MLDQAMPQSVGGTSVIERSLRTILYTGLTAGMLDITAAFTNTWLHGRGLIVVVQSIAGGLLGRSAYQGGLKTAALGLVLHFIIATIWGAVYYAASLKLPLLTRRAVPCGLFYGVVVYLVMYGVVLPLSALRVPPLNQAPTAMLTSVLIHMFCVGLPIALMVRRHTD